MKELLQEIKKYFKLLDRNTTTKWDCGYFLSDNQKLREKEELFLKLVPEYENKIIRIIENNPKSKDMIYYISLLGWGRNVKRVSKFLIDILINNKSHKIHNYAARALFPLVVSGKAKIRIEEVLKLLNHNNKYCKNKALGILAFMPLSNKNKKELRLFLSDINKLANSENEIVNKPAKLLLRRL